MSELNRIPPDADAELVAGQLFDRLVALARRRGEAELGDAAPAGPEQAELFTRGCLDRLQSLEPVERPAFLRALARDLGQLSSPLANSLLASLRLQLPEAELSLLIEAMVVDLARISNDFNKMPTMGGGTWLLEQLLGWVGEGARLGQPSELHKLVERAELLLQQGSDRWAVLRRLAVECDNLWLLHYLCSSPDLFGPEQLAVRLLARGSHRHVSCALFALWLAPGRAQEVCPALVDELEQQERSAACARILDIYSQLWLHRGEPEVLRATLLRWLAARVRPEEQDEHGSGRTVADEGDRWLAGVIDALTPGPRMLRQVFLLADLAELLRNRSPRHAALLHREVLRVFSAAFTPAGARHPLADALWRARTGDALAEAMELYPELADRLEQFGLGLPRTAARWLESRAAREQGWGGERLEELSSLFLRLFGGTVSHAARAQWRRQPCSAAALRSYRILARVLTEHRRHAAGAGAFGALEHLLSPEASREMPEELLGKAATIDLRAQDRQGGRRRTRWLPATLHDELDLETSSTTGSPLSSESELWSGQPIWARLLRRIPGRSLLGTLLGIDAMLLLLSLPLRLLGFQRLGELRLDGDQLVLRRAFKLLGVRGGTRELRLPLEGLRVERRSLPRARFARLAGWTVLAAGAVLGTVLLYTGLESGATGTALAGACMIAGTLLYDASCHHRYLQGREERLLLLTPVGRSRPLPLAVERADQERVAARLGRG